MILTATRLTYRINRFEIQAIVAATALSAIVSAIVVTWLQRSGYVDCINVYDTPPVACLQMMTVGSWMTKIASISMNLVSVFPFLAGILLGGPLIARELDRGTARLAWSLGPSRMRWFVQRVVPILLLVAGVSFAIGVVGERLVALFAPGVDLANSFVASRERGILIMTGALLAASIGVAIGAIVGRTMPTLILALVLAGAGGLAIHGVNQNLLTGEAVPLPDSSGNDLQFDSRFRLPDGRLVTYDELSIIDPSINSIDGFGPDKYPYVALGIPGSRFREVEGREAIAQLLIAAAFLGLAAFVVTRRRPG